MQHVMAIVALLGAPPATESPAPEVHVLWPERPPGEKSDVGPEKLLPQRSGRRPVKRITDVSRPTLTVFRPAANKNTGTAVIVCPGGGYRILAWDLEGEEVAQWLTSIGVTAFVLKYRVPRRPGDPRDKPPPGPLQDAQRAIRFVRSKAGKWNIDSQRIGILGFSAGGNLAARASVRFDRPAYEPIDEIDKASSRPDFAVLVYPAYLVNEDTDTLADELRVTKQTPPMFFAHAADDRISATNSVLMYLALERAGVVGELHVYASGGHGFGLRPSDNPCSAWPRQCAAWMRSMGWLKKAETDR